MEVLALIFGFLVGGLAAWCGPRLTGSADRGKVRLKEAEARAARLRILLDNINDGVYAADPELRPLFVNRRFRSIFGGPCESKQLTDFVHPDHRNLLAARIERCLQRRENGVRAEYRGRRADGSELPVQIALTAVESGGLLVGLQAVVRDISHERLIETSQRALAQRLEFFFSEMPLACIIWDSDFRVQEWNEAAERIFGWTASEALQCPYAELVAAGPNDPIERALKQLVRGRATSRQQCRNHAKDGSELECEWFHTSLLGDNGEVTAVASMVQDVTQRRSLEQQLAQAQKMEAVGTLAGGVAHDFNNLLTTILGNVALSRMQLGKQHPCERGLKDAEAAAERAAELTQQLLRFSRKSPARAEPIVLSSNLEEVAELFRYGLPSDVRLECEIAEDLWPVEADAGQIGQLVMNLLVNARDAVAAGGCVRLEARNRVLSTEFCEGRAWALPGKWVEIKVIDDGVGIDAGARPRIFEPFFTTKPIGKGTGLGLSVVYGIVNNHRGGLEVESEVGRGTRFSVFLRRTAADRAAGTAELDEPAAGGSATILLADDQKEVRRLTARILADHGYRVIEACDGVEALQAVRARGDEIDLAVMDMTMPNKNGREAFEAMRAAGADFPVVLASGYAGDVEPPPGADYLSKPYTPRELLNTVSAALARRALASN